MKKLLSYLIIIFFSSLTFSFSEGISDFEIEGISVDGNVYDYFTEETLNKRTKKKRDDVAARSADSTYNFNVSSTDSYGELKASPKKKAGEIFMETSIPNKNLELYDAVRVVYFSKTNIIKNVTGIKYFEKKGCNGKQKEAFDDLSKILEGDYKLDKKKETQQERYTFYLKNGGSIEIACYDGHSDREWLSALMMTINSKGIKKTPEEDTTLSSGEKTKTKSEFIQIKPAQANIEDRIKF